MTSTSVVLGIGTPGLPGATTDCDCASTGSNATRKGIMNFILFPRERRWPSGRRGIAKHVALRASRDPHFSMFAKVLWDWFLVYCMDVQFSADRCSSPAPAGEGQACYVALRLGARGQHG